MSAPRPIEFLFDYASPWSFLANALLRKKLGDAPIVYRPVYLRGFSSFAKGIPYSSEKLAYLTVDLQRCARHEGVEMAPPASFPVNGLYALRGALAAQDLGCFARYHDVVFRATWQEGRETSTAEAVAAVARAAGLDEVAGALAAPKYKDKLRADTEAAARRGAFGVPTFFVGDELFWGHDRMDYVARAAR